MPLSSYDVTIDPAYTLYLYYICLYLYIKCLFFLNSFIHVFLPVMPLPAARASLLLWPQGFSLSGRLFLQSAGPGERGLP